MHLNCNTNTYEHYACKLFCLMLLRSMTPRAGPHVVGRLDVLWPSPHSCFCRLFCHEKKFRALYNSLQSLHVHLTTVTRPHISRYSPHCNMYASYVHVTYAMSARAATLLRCRDMQLCHAITTLPRDMSTWYVETRLRAGEDKYVMNSTYILVPVDHIQFLIVPCMEHFISRHVAQVLRSNVCCHQSKMCTTLHCTVCVICEPFH